MVERRTPNPDVGGSNPSWPAKKYLNISMVFILAHVLVVLGSKVIGADVYYGSEHKIEKTKRCED